VYRSAARVRGERAPRAATSPHARRAHRFANPRHDTDFGVAPGLLGHGPEEDAMKPNTVLVPLDGSRLAEEALAPALGFAREGAKLVLLRAAEAHAPFMDPSEAQVAVVREAEEYLAGVAARLRSAGASEVEMSVWYDSPVEAIADAARFRKVDLIVMSTHGRSGLGRLVLGSVAESVLRATSTPILLLRPQAPAWVAIAEEETVRV
jgi:nucleotide-binding universal stress UspA family protein